MSPKIDPKTLKMIDIVLKRAKDTEHELKMLSHILAVIAKIYGININMDTWVIVDD